MSCLVTCLHQSQAAPFLWDPLGTAGASDGSGNWDDITVSNWFNGSAVTTWPSGGTNAVIGGAVPGAYNITNINTVTAVTLTFSNANGYTISGNQLTASGANLTPTIISASNTTNTIAAVYRTSNGGDITNAPNSALIFTGGGSSSSNPRILGVAQSSSTTMLNGGTYNMGVGTLQISGTTLSVSNAILNGGGRVDVGRNQANPSTSLSAGTVNVFNGGQLNANSGAGNNSGNHLQLSRSAPAILNVYPGGLVTTTVYSGLTTANSSPSGNLRILPDSGSQGTLNVLGGTVLVGDGPGTYGSAGSYSIALLMLTFFDAAPTANASSRAVLNMTGGSITANQVAFTEPGGFATTNPTNGINLTGGTLYLGAPNISFPVGGMGTNFFLNLSGGAVAAIQNWSPACSAPINLTNVNGNVTFQTADINGTSFNMAFSGPLTGVGGFYKTGGGTLTLSGADNYSGLTVVSNGTLVVSTLNSPVAGPVTIEGDTATVGPVNSVLIASSGQSWATGTLTYDTGTPTADFNYGSFNPSTTVAPIQVNGNLVYNVTPQVTVEGSAIPVGIFPLIHYSGTLSGSAPTAVALSGGAYSGYITNITASKTLALVVTVSPVINGLVWAAGSGPWDMSTHDWSYNGVVTNYTDPEPVTFNDTASGPFPISINVTGTVSPQSITVSATNSYAVAGPGVIAGGASLTKTGSGTLTLSGTNTYNGGTTVEVGGGTLNINYGGDGANNSAIGTGPLTLKTSARLGNTSGHAITLLTPITQYWNDDWTFVGTNNMNLGSSPVTLGNGQVVLTVVTNILEEDGQITDNGLGYGIQKQGSGTLTLSNLNTFGGGMDVEAGVLNINSDGAVGNGLLTLANNAAIDNTSGSPVTLNSGPGTINFKGFSFLGAGNLDLGAAPITVQTSTLNVNNNTLFVEGALNGASTSLTKTGVGALTIGGSASTGSVTFILNAGTVNLNRQPGFIGINVQGVMINAGSALVILNPTGSEFNQTPITLNGGSLEWNGDNETLASLVFNSGILRDSNPTTASLSLLSGGLLTLGGMAQFDITNGATLTINGIVAGTTTNTILLKTGAGTMVLATNLTYTGNTTVSNGVLTLDYPDLATNSTVTIATNAMLNLNFTNSDTNTVGALILNGTTAAAGLHNASTDPAYITGTGSLLITPPVTINPYPGTILTSLTGNTLNLGWPTNAGWLLQAQTNSLQVGLGTNWVTVPGSDAITNLSVTINPANGAVFYRMVHP